jgi:hypothetical protein
MSKHQTTAHDTGGTSEQVRESTDRELTEDHLNQITGGITPSIPIPPPTPQVYAIGRIEARFPH